MLHEHVPVRDFETKLRTKSGEIREVLAALELIELDGEACVLTILYDIIDRKRAEAEVRNLNAQLGVTGGISCSRLPVQKRQYHISLGIVLLTERDRAWSCSTCAVRSRW
jgi:PAS domain-containing protein